MLLDKAIVFLLQLLDGSVQLIDILVCCLTNCIDLHCRFITQTLPKAFHQLNHFFWQVFFHCQLSCIAVACFPAAQMSSNDAQLAKRYQAVRLYGSGYAVSEIQTICGCSLPSLWEWSRKYQQAGVAGLVDQRLSTRLHLF